MSDILKQILQFGNSYRRQSILNVLPLSGDKIHKGLTRKQIVEKTGVSPKKVSQYLQALKGHGVRCYRGRWRQTAKSSFWV